MAISVVLAQPMALVVAQLAAANQVVVEAPEQRAPEKMVAQE